MVLTILNNGQTIFKTVDYITLYRVFAVISIERFCLSISEKLKKFISR